MDIQISNEIRLSGTQPVVILGPNGSGKTRLASSIAARHDAEIVAALRNIQLPDNISPQPTAQAESNLRNELRRRRDSYWELGNEINALFSKLLAEHASAAMQFTDAIRHGQKMEPPDTPLERVRELWARVFPGRTIDFNQYAPQVTSQLSGSDTSYSASRMSDGERVALFLAARVFNATAGLLIIDEPEVHFHSLLAVRFWDELERARSDIRFIYVTHDMTFALSRVGAQFVLVRANAEPEVLPVGADLPEPVARALLGAASLSIYAQRVVFCEGTESKSLDARLFRAWFVGRETAVVPVGSCGEVLQCVKAFNDSGLVRGVEALGIIDRDYWPDTYLTSLSPSVHVLPVHEVECLFCLHDVFIALASHLGQSAEAAEQRYACYLERVRAMATGGFLAKQISERVKGRLAPSLQGALSAVAVTDDLDALRMAFDLAGQMPSIPKEVAAAFAEERQRVEHAATATDQQSTLAVLPGKPIVELACRELGLDSQSLMELVEAALRSEGQDKRELRVALEAALGPYLPSRLVAPVQ